MPDVAKYVNGSRRTTLPMRDGSELALACSENRLDSMKWLAGVTGGLVETVGGATLVRTSIPLAQMNQAFVLGEPSSLQEVAQGVRRAFVDSHVPWQLVTDAGQSKALQPLVDELGLARVEIEPGMALDPLPQVCPPPPAGLEIRQAEEPEDLLTFLRISDVAFRSPAGSMDSILGGLDMPAAEFQGGAYLGYFGGRPVATSARFSTGNAAGVHFVSTLAEFRGRGFGEAMTWRAAMDGRAEGCEFSVLYSSEMGFPVYERMGYRTVVRYQTWETRR